MDDAKKYLTIFLDIVYSYKEKMEINLVKGDDFTPCCNPYEKTIDFPLQRAINANNRTCFDLLHEIGHIETNKKGMKRCEEEYYATQWALNHAIQYGVNVTLALIETFQEYIWNWRTIGIKRGAKIIPSENELELDFVF